MDCLPPPQTPHPRPRRALALRSVGGVVTPLPDGEVVLGREGSLGLGITSPLVSRQQALLVRDGAGGLRLVSRGRVNPTLLVRDGGAVLRLAQGESVEVSPGDAIVLRGDRVLREGAGSLVSDDEAFTLVDEEAPDMDLAAALSEIARLRAELDAARRAPATPAAAEPTDAEAAPAAAPSPMEEEVERPMEPTAAPSPTEEAERPLDSQGTVEPTAAPSPMEEEAERPMEQTAAPSPMEEEIERPMDSQGTVVATPAAAEAPLAVDAVDALRLTKGLEVASLTYTEDGKRLAARWRGGGATRRPRARGRRRAPSRRFDAARARAEAAEGDDDDDSVGDFDDDPCATSALVAAELDSETDDSPYEASDDEERGGAPRATNKAETRGSKFVERLLAGAAAEGVVSSMRWDGDSLRGAVSGGDRQVVVTVEVRAAGDAVVLRASCRRTKDHKSWGAGVGLADSVPALQLLRFAAIKPGDVARVRDVAADAAKLAPRAVADVLLHAVATAEKPTSAYDGLKAVISDPGEAAAAASYVASCRAKLVSLYELYNPAKLNEVDDLLAKYAGREAHFLSAVERKYSGADAIPLLKDEAAVMQGVIAAPVTVSLLVDVDAFSKLALPAAIASVMRKYRVHAPARPGQQPTAMTWKYELCFKLVSPIFYDAEEGVVFGRVQRTNTADPNDHSYEGGADVAFKAVRVAEGLRLDLARSWSQADDNWSQPLLTPAAIAFAKLASTRHAVEVDALRSALLALPDVRAAAVDVAFSPATSGAGLDVALPRLLAEAASAGAASPGAAYVRDLDAVVLDAEAPKDDPAVASLEETTATAVMAYVEEAKDAFEEKEREVEETRENWVNGKDCDCSPEYYGRGGCPCGEWRCGGDCGEAEIHCDCATDLNPLPDPDEFAGKKLKKTVDAILGRADGVPENVREALLAGVVGGLIDARDNALEGRRVLRGPGGVKGFVAASEIDEALRAEIDTRLDDLTGRAAKLAKAGRPGLVARLVPLRPMVAFPSEDLIEAMATAPESKPVLLAAVNAAAAKLGARLRDAGDKYYAVRDFAAARSNIRELLARGWLDKWETVADACALDGADKLSHCMDVVEFALEVARHEAAPDETLPALAARGATLRAIAAEDAGAGAAAAAKRALGAIAEAKLWDRWLVVARVAVELDRGAETVAAAARGAAAFLAHDVKAGAAAVRAGIADGWLPADRSLAVEAFAGPAPRNQRVALYELALDEADAAPSLHDSVLDAIASRPNDGLLADAPDAFLDRVAALRPDLAVSLCLASLDGAGGRKRAARVLIAHGSDDALLAFVRAEVAEAAKKATKVSFVAQSADLGITFTHASRDPHTSGSYGQRGLKVITVTGAAEAAGVRVGMQLDTINGVSVGRDGPEALRSRLRMATRPTTLTFSWSAPVAQRTQPVSHYNYNYNNDRFQDTQFDNAVSAAYEELRRAHADSIPTSVDWLHSMLVSSDRRCGEAACALTAGAYDAAAARWPVRLATDLGAVANAPIPQSPCTTGHPGAEHVWRCSRCSGTCNAGVRAMAQVRALIRAGVSESVAGHVLGSLAERTINLLSIKVRTKVEAPLRMLVTRPGPDVGPRFEMTKRLPEWEGLKMAPYAHPRRRPRRRARRAPTTRRRGSPPSSRRRRSKRWPRRARAEAIDGEALRSMGEDELCDVLFQGANRARGSRRGSSRSGSGRPARRAAGRRRRLDRGLAAWGARRSCPSSTARCSRRSTTTSSTPSWASTTTRSRAPRRTRSARANLCRRAVPGFDDALPPKPETLHEVVVVGSTGAGKSSLLNALVGEAEVLPTNCMRACTHAPVVALECLARARARAPYEVEVAFLSRDEWAAALAPLAAHREQHGAAVPPADSAGRARGASRTRRRTRRGRRPSSTSGWGP
ncbi:hypothetical protein SO694_000066109 [Aureococcus anophagefferens]|uniref:PDZ domain-containing protein n=1 Tax=Aureococcus anophagefferens TaxID=44056 RepID=A0ABR1GAK4_AURAN